MTAGPKPGDEATPASTQWYTYDAWNRLVTVSQGAASPGTLVVTYSYDGLNRRIRKLIEAGETDITYDFYYNTGWQVLEVRKDEATNANPLKQYVWGAQYIDAPIVRFYDGDQDGDVEDEGDNTLYYTYDAQFNVTSLVDASTNDVAERYAYDPYGKVTALNGADGSDGDDDGDEWTVDSDGGDWDNEILYCGYRWDRETELYHVRHRYYHPTLGRWATRDPIVYGDGMNLYQYVGSNPTRYVDPAGTWKRVTKNGHVWEAEKRDTLWGLAAKQEYGGNGQNWRCLWPTKDTKDHGYPKTIHPCDKYDASNLAAPVSGASELKLSVSGDTRDFGGPVVNGNEVVSRIQATSGEGGTPISLFILEGHSGNGRMGGKYVKEGGSWVWKGAKLPFTVGLYTKLADPAPTFTRAQERKGPKRCWFTRDAHAWFGGCNSSSIAEAFAKSALRSGATAHGTKTYSGINPKTGIYWGKIKWVNGQAQWEGKPHHNKNWRHSGAWNAYDGRL